ncbi:TfoX/Sxy family protein [Bradyrhizobium sp. U87765 SZCCT0131]|uniref:TfoX/Sxy family protein n=1 Tax=unclassified Bradyrhizobium TaxID=2631580 RepID=UPI001BAD5858|nr:MULTISPECIES: TfoX/Sxy family protein [unclassified Bradyrhizobium]MBR1220343.1 TfoX/Sxy family protein [Bradyrhizobium sp. U87765 SZCCT0131]MBR1263202.1 TfoX/Sxy family protein [Bradyrhizobium sp. U87765 SZCCT0134]MBR1306915.1 TfoX/Sxy family protein [Bradyrhizobium sp. U87765 SZCCT0110]MBR1323414.1 TfoX/Sxy family protein [Bradyrhizobium sp. U87765 SZCCT0109]MBR1345869.1 TfoX/Sxy family protein [Bradyrhizobium sp. U87765 SZCCT0048]
MDREFLQDLFSAFGPVGLRRMFSGYGVSVDGVNFALVLRGAIYFRTDEHNVARFEDEGVKPFQYAARGKLVTINSYWQLPDRLYDDPEELAEWARASLGAAERAAAVKRSREARSAAKGTARGPAKSAIPATGRSGTGAAAKLSGRPAKAPAASRSAKPSRAGKAASAGKTASAGKDKGKRRGTRKGKISAATETPVRPKAARKASVRTASAKATKSGSGAPPRKSPSGPTRR